MNRDKRVLNQIVKEWAAEHSGAYIIADYDQTEEALDKTGGHLTWTIREGHVNLNLRALVERLEILLMVRQIKKHPDGMSCAKCHEFYEFAEGNQEDGTLVCYSCSHPCG